VVPDLAAPKFSRDLTTRGNRNCVRRGQKYARRFAYPVGDHRALLELEIERGADELLRNLEQPLGKRYQLFCRQAAMSSSMASVSA
jgi:hypothetical protein